MSDIGLETTPVRKSPISFLMKLFGEHTHIPEKFLDRKSLEKQLPGLLNRNWEEELRDVIFQGNLSGGTRYMQSFIQGEIDVLKALQKRNMIRAGYTLPETRLAYPEVYDYFQTRYDSHQITMPTGETRIEKYLSVNPDYVEDVKYI